MDDQQEARNSTADPSGDHTTIDDACYAECATSSPMGNPWNFDVFRCVNWWLDHRQQAVFGGDLTLPAFVLVFDECHNLMAEACEEPIDDDTNTRHHDGEGHLEQGGRHRLPASV